MPTTPGRPTSIGLRPFWKRLFPFGYFRASGRGQNGYLKIRYPSIRDFNTAADRLQETLKRLFLHLGILCDVEVKGTITHDEKSGRLAKLPFNSTCPCAMRDETDNWNYLQLNKFRGCPVVGLQRVEYLIGRLDNRFNEAKVRQFAEYKKSLEDREREEQGKKPKDSRKWAAKQSTTPVATGSPAKQPETQQPTPATKPDAETMTASPSSHTIAGIIFPQRSSDDAFVRNQEDMRPFVRAFYRQYHRFPTTEETLDWLKANGRYSGDWEDGVNKRAKRVGQILAYTEQNFDPKMLSMGETKPVSLDVRKFSWWVRQQFGSVMTARFFNYREVDPLTMTVPITEVSIPARFVATFLAVADFCLREDPLENKAVPTNRIKKLWEMVEGGAPWNQKYYQIVRDRLDRMGVIRICDRNHDNGKAWRWEAGEHFPEDSWKDEQRKLWEKGKLRTGTAVALADFLPFTRIGINCEVHNTLYKDANRISGLRDKIAEVRGPP